MPAAGSVGPAFTVCPQLALQPSGDTILAPAPAWVFVDGGLRGWGLDLHSRRQQGSHKVLYYRPTKTEECWRLISLPGPSPLHQQQQKTNAAGKLDWGGGGFCSERTRDTRMRRLPPWPGPRGVAWSLSNGRAAMANSTGADKRTGLEGAVPTPPAAAVPLPTAARAVGQLGSTGPQGSVREDRGQRAGPLCACQPISFFRKASSCSSSLMPTNLSTTSPFFMASTVGTADTSYSMARSV